MGKFKDFVKHYNGWIETSTIINDRYLLVKTSRSSVCISYQDPEDIYQLKFTKDCKYRNEMCECTNRYEVYDMENPNDANYCLLPFESEEEYFSWVIVDSVLGKEQYSEQYVHTKVV